MPERYTLTKADADGCREILAERKSYHAQVARVYRREAADWGALADLVGLAAARTHAVTDTVLTRAAQRLAARLENHHA